MAERGRNAGGGRWLEWLSLPLLLVLWHLLSLLVDHRLFPTPIAVFAEMWDLLVNRRLAEDVGKTLTRAAIAFVLSMIVGIAVGAAIGRFRAADRLFGSWVLIGLNIPAIVVAIACYIWMGLTEAALILAVCINKTPLVAVTVREGVRALDAGYAELGRVYRVPFLRRIRRIVVPQLMPYVLAAARTGLSLIWKIVLVFEVLGSDGGVGFRIGIFFQNFDMKGILAYTLAFMSIVIALEYLVMRRLDQRVLGWRPVQRTP
ncbi:ABC transporter permease [Wenxinia marina]|uniref:ABC-type nitrate/sulfonate/bicarbonate transport system, permease component n=1 Tax=Wenxinia marina DSM 24838 TaxID=1123501 RepID=A0A0D0NL75_9RHOB|nr:ABC transporter permease subunit [Wenxinia marina]KIQ69060.1 ABC-type nitrate/sulfonate/bicarbonate transport system, permease component [Wenxinia marina DSM 24838]GGL70037.1 ABC transporter permease [Wenxinia marina]